MRNGAPAVEGRDGVAFDDWRDAARVELDALYGAEARRWLGTLGWDVTPSWEIVEEARAAGRLPGLLARQADGTAVGWAFYLLYEGRLQIGGLVGDTAGVVRALLERILQSPEAGLARGFSSFVFPASPSLQSALERQRFTLNRHLYLSRSLSGSEAVAALLPPDLSLRPFGDADPADVVRLLARAYAGRPEARCFAPDARLDQWAHYVGQLLATPAVGRFLPSASFVARSADSARPVAAIVTTSLSPGTAHVAQVVVDPACRRGGLGRALLHAAFDAAHAAGHERMTLLVAEANEPARTLYARTGFTEISHFLYAARPALTRRVATSPQRQVAAGG